MKQIKESWVNVYEEKDGKRDFGQIYNSKEECLNNMVSYDWRKYICIIPLHELKSDEA